MRNSKIFGIFGTFLFSNWALADPFAVCGTVTCSSLGSAAIFSATGIDDLVVDGKQFDVTFGAAAQSTSFAFSSYASTSGQPLTGVDAANALSAFFATQGLPNIQADGPFTNNDGVVTAYQLSQATPGIVYLDITQPFIGGPGLQYSQVPTVDSPPQAGTTVVEETSSANLCRSNTCTQWTAVTAPEISSASAISALTLLLGSIAVLRGRRPTQLVRD